MIIVSIWSQYYCELVSFPGLVPRLCAVSFPGLCTEPGMRLTEDHSPIQFPVLCQQFYTLIHYICEIFPERVAVLPEELFVACLQLLEAGVSK